MMRRRDFLGLSASLLALTATGVHAQQATILGTLYKNPQCGCCDTYVAYLEPLGFRIDVRSTVDLASVKRQAGVPDDLAGCHTLFIDGYVVEGLVPVEVLRRLLTERPAIVGISLPGMPVGVPGMPGLREGPLEIYEISTLLPKVYAVI